MEEKPVNKKYNTQNFNSSQSFLMLVLLTAIVSWAAAPSVLARGGGNNGGPVILMGIDAEDGGVGGHGPIANYVSVVNSIYGQTSNNGTGILVIGANGSNPQDFWNTIGTQTGYTITYVTGASNVSSQSFNSFRMIAVVGSDDETSGGLTIAEHNALIPRQNDIANFVNTGGGLLGFSSFPESPYAYLAGFGSFSISTGLSYSDITPTQDGINVGITDALDICCWHNEFNSFPAFFNVLAFSGGNNELRLNGGGGGGSGQPAAIGGTSVFIPSGADLSITNFSSRRTASVGNTITYTIIITNNESNIPPPPPPTFRPDGIPPNQQGNAEGLVMTDTLAPGTTFVSVSFPRRWRCKTPAVGQTGTIRCRYSILEAGDSATFAVRVKVAPNTPAGTHLFNSASVSADTDDPDSSNNGALADTTVTSSSGRTNSFNEDSSISEPLISKLINGDVFKPR